MPNCSYTYTNLNIIKVQLYHEGWAYDRGFPGGASGNEPAGQCRISKRRGFDPWVGKPLEKENTGEITPVLLLGESHGQRSLVGYSPWSCRKSDTTEATYLAQYHKAVPKMAVKIIKSLLFLTFLLYLIVSLFSALLQSPGGNLNVVRKLNSSGVKTVPCLVVDC